MANTIYWTPWMAQLQQANNTSSFSKQIAQVGKYQKRIDDMGKWGWWENATAELLEVLSLKEQSVQSSGLVNCGRLVFMAENTDLRPRPDIVTDFRWGHEDNRLVRRLYYVLSTSSENVLQYIILKAWLKGISSLKIWSSRRILFINSFICFKNSF